MNIQYALHRLDPRDIAAGPIDQSLERLGRVIRISSARVDLEYQRDVTPAFCASVNLAVPGPDIHAAARDHTLQAAMLKVIRRIEEQVEHRKSHQQLRLKRRNSCRRVSSQWSR